VAGSCERDNESLDSRTAGNFFTTWTTISFSSILRRIFWLGKIIPRTNEFGKVFDVACDNFGRQSCKHYMYLKL
jgi:hypothetical protein